MSTNRETAIAEATSKEPAVEALDLMARALGLLDATTAPSDAGAHLDIAIHRLRDWIAAKP